MNSSIAYYQYLYMS